MCFSKRSPDNEQFKTSTTQRPMDENKNIKCPTGENECDHEFCMKNGLCCVENGKEEPRHCACFNDFIGLRCERKSRLESIDRLERTQALAAFSAVLGLIVITLFIVLVFLQIKYYKHRKKRLLEKDDLEMDKFSKPDASDRGSKRNLTNQPGYSWRESVRGHSKASRKLRGPSSRSVPEDLFKVALKLAAFGALPHQIIGHDPLHDTPAKEMHLGVAKGETFTTTSSSSNNNQLTDCHNEGEKATSSEQSCSIPQQEKQQQNVECQNTSTTSDSVNL